MPLFAAPREAPALGPVDGNAAGTRLPKIRTRAEPSKVDGAHRASACQRFPRRAVALGRLSPSQTMRGALRARLAVSFGPAHPRLVRHAYYRADSSLKRCRARRLALGRWRA